MENLLFAVQTIYLEAVRVRRMNRASLPCQPEPGYSFTRCVQHSVSQVGHGKSYIFFQAYCIAAL